ncbi:MAG: hypothetical protein E6G83_07595 [Alphaproteobacteria bacterium]|nr:MAG: hypothetical protein E6G83_07595 [Alphaproteobacteria bacterium]
MSQCLSLSPAKGLGRRRRCAGLPYPGRMASPSFHVKGSSSPARSPAAGYLLHRWAPCSAGRHSAGSRATIAYCAAAGFSWTVPGQLSRVTDISKRLYTNAMIGVGMRQCDLVSATAPTSRDDGPSLFVAPAGFGLLAAGIGAAETRAIEALFPDFTISHRLPAATGVSAVVSWSDLRRKGRPRRRAAALGVPFLLFGSGLLRAPPGWGARNPVLSVTAQAMTGPRSPIDLLDPERLLASSGWESSGLLGRASGLRHQIVSRRLAGPWWSREPDPGLPRGGRHALILGDSNPEGSNSLELLNAMLQAARAENASRQTVIVAPRHRGGRRLAAGFLRDAAANGCTVLTGTVDIWEAIGGAESVYTAGGETGFLALLAGARIRCFADSFYSGWGITMDEPGVPQKPLRRTIDEVFAGACLRNVVLETSAGPRFFPVERWHAGLSAYHGRGACGRPPQATRQHRRLGLARPGGAR